MSEWSDVAKELEGISTSDAYDIDAVKACLLQMTKCQVSKNNEPSHVAWARCIRLIVQKIIPKWAFSLHTLSNELHCVVNTNPNISLLVLLEAIQSDVPFDVLEWYSRLLKDLVQSPLSVWQTNDSIFLCSALCSIPSRIVNAFGPQYRGDEWNYYAMLSKRIEQFVLDMCDGLHGLKQEAQIHNMSKQTLFVSELLGKMLRLGQQDVCIDTLVPHIAPVCIHDTLLARTWSTIWEKVENISTTEKAVHAILSRVQEQTEIPWIALAISNMLFTQHGESDSSRSQRIHSFFTAATVQLSKRRWANTTTARLAVAITLRSAGLEPADNGEKKQELSDTASHLLMTLIRDIIDIWADPIFIQHAKYQERIYITTVLLLLFGYASRSTLRSVMTETMLMSGIGRWFETADNAIAKLGVVVAESLSDRVDEGDAKLNCGVLDSEHDQMLLSMKSFVHIADGLDAVGDVNPFSKISDSEEDRGTTDELVKVFDPDAPVLPDQDSEDDSDDHESMSNESDLEPYPMEEESDEETDSAKPRKQRPKAPVYILDVIAYLKEHEDPVKLDLGLASAERVIRQKTGAGTEIADHAIVLAKRLIGFPEDYDIECMRQRQQGALTALIVACPHEAAGFIIDQIYDRNTSPAQKQMLLASITFAVREMAGWNKLEGEERDSIEQPLDNMLRALEDTHLGGTTNRVGKVRVFSKSHEIRERERSRVKRNQLSGLAGPVFFFPLLVGWWEGAQHRIKSWIGRDPLLAERFIMTLNVVMHCATNTTDKRRIVMEYFEFALSLRYANCSRGMKQALLLGLDIILNTSYQGQEKLLMDDYSRELVETKVWLEDIMELVNEDELKRTAIQLLARLAAISISADGSHRS